MKSNSKINYGNSTYMNTIESQVSIPVSELDDANLFSPLNIEYSSNLNNSPTNFCIHINCLLPLGPKDIKSHLKYHQEVGIPPEIEAIEDVILSINKKLEDSKKELGMQERKLKNIMSNISLDKKDKIIENLNQSKQKLIQIIDDYYKMIIEKINEIYHNAYIDNTTLEIYNDINDRLYKELKAIQEDELGLIEKNNFVDIIQRVYGKNITHDMINLKEDIEILSKKAYNKTANIAIDQNIYNILNNKLYECIQINFDNENIFMGNRTYKSDFNEGDYNALSSNSKYVGFRKYSEKYSSNNGKLDKKHQKYSMKNDSGIENSNTKNQKKFEFNTESKTDSWINTKKKESSLNIYGNQQELFRGSDSFAKSFGSNNLNKDVNCALSFDSSLHILQKARTTASFFSTKTKRDTHRFKNPEVQISDYFLPYCSHKYLHFFEDNTKKLHLLDISNIENQSSLGFQVLNLNIDFNIPQWHRSIITPEGIIFLMGGSIASLKHQNNLNNVYEYDYQRKTLIKKPSMKFSRNSHGVCLLKGEIYVIGGCLNENGYTCECEKYDYSSESNSEWESIAPLNHPALAPCITNFRNKFLYKFGGILGINTMNNYIEKYDPILNEWSIINYKLFNSDDYPGMNLMAYSACVQINSDEIYIFGGSEEESKTNLTYKAKIIEDSLTIEKVDLTLPYYGTFSNEALIHHGKILCLQNVQLNRFDTFHFGKRKILCYEDNIWYEVK